MDFNKHYDLRDKHALLSPSKVYWLNYSKDQLRAAIINEQAKVRGTKLHALAKELIEEGLKLRGSTQTLSAYVNDAIGYGMVPELPIYFTDNCFGTADSIFYKPGILRIHDLKTGLTPAKMEQLEIYAALFMLEYEKKFGVNPFNTKVNLRIYQSDDIIEEEPDPERISEVMDLIKEKDQWANDIQGEI